MTKIQHRYKVRPRKDKRGVDLISDALPFGQDRSRIADDRHIDHRRPVSLTIPARFTARGGL
jgi:hypothetical protein